MRVLVCGGRDYADRSGLYAALDALDPKPTTIISGMASGADQLAWYWARSRNVPVLEFPANWREHGKAAGPLRNERMLTEGRPDMVMAFPGGRGTADMKRRAKKAGIEVRDAHCTGR